LLTGCTSISPIITQEVEELGQHAEAQVDGRSREAGTLCEADKVRDVLGGDLTKVGGECALPRLGQVSEEPLADRDDCLDGSRRVLPRLKRAQITQDLVSAGSAQKSELGCEARFK
jgi:hypothetical protein